MITTKYIAPKKPTIGHTEIYLDYNYIGFIYPNKKPDREPGDNWIFTAVNFNRQHARGRTRKELLKIIESL